MRIGIRFSRKGGTRFISHLDMQRTFARALRRTGLPVKTSEGFNPHIVMSFAAAMSVGMESVGDYIEFATTQDVDLSTLPALFDRCLPLEIRAEKIGRIADGTMRLMASVVESEVEYFPITDHDGILLTDGLQKILEQEEFLIEKKGKQGYKKVFKTVDIRPLIHDVHFRPSSVILRLALSNDAALNPFVLLKEAEKLVGETIRVRVVRRDLFAAGGVSLSEMLLSE